MDWWPNDKCDYGDCPWQNASLLTVDLADPLLLAATELLRRHIRKRTKAHPVDNLVDERSKLCRIGNRLDDCELWPTIDIHFQRYEIFGLGCCLEFLQETHILVDRILVNRHVMKFELAAHIARHVAPPQLRIVSGRLPRINTVKGDAIAPVKLYKQRQRWAMRDCSERFR